nr:ankyrin repeat domain-containing protein [Agrococcus sp. ARC_14]
MHRQYDGHRPPSWAPHTGWIWTEHSVQAIFTEIVADDVDTVRARLAKDPGSVSLVASGTPKKYAGRSPLMVALITGKFEIAELLLDHGADVDFFDGTNQPPYARPVLHDAITAATLRARPKRADMRGPGDSTETSFAILGRMLESGANIDAVSSNGNSSLHRAAMDAAQVLPSKMPAEQLDEVFTRNLERIFDLLFTHGADQHRIEPVLETSVAWHYRNHLVGGFLRIEAA